MKEGPTVDVQHAKRDVQKAGSHIEDLHKADSDSDGGVAAGSNAIKDALHDTRDDAPSTAGCCENRAPHGVCFARASLAIGKAACIIALEQADNKRLNTLIIQHVW